MGKIINRNLSAAQRRAAAAVVGTLSREEINTLLAVTKKLEKSGYELTLREQ